MRIRYGPAVFEILGDAAPTGLVGRPSLYSYLTAATGSIRDGRRAGTYAASEAIKRIATAELDKMSGSIGDSSNRTPARTARATSAVANAAGTPMASPTATIRPSNSDVDLKTAAAL